MISRNAPKKGESPGSASNTTRAHKPGPDSTPRANEQPKDCSKQKDANYFTGTGCPGASRCMA